jgi:hypothetical protein
MSESPKPDAKDFVNGQPYTNIAGDLIANCIVLMEHVRERRPEVKTLPGNLHVTLDSEHGTILVGLSQSNGEVILVERILANVKDPANFGKSELPLAVKKQQFH